MENYLIDKIEEISFTRVKKGDSLWESRVMDSITIVELAVEIEEEFSVSFTPEKIGSMISMELIIHELKKSKL